ncbi:fumarylacetoacetate hydrolase family protein [Peribacillus frigoritolerans]|nr:fumarylacetoacetate hydrolase family protein [Peribacillus frigoritolerans]
MSSESAEKNIKEEDALDYVFGCTIFNDVTARDLTKKRSTVYAGQRI